MSTAEENRERVIAFYKMMFNDCNPAEAVQRYVGDDYIQHNVHVSSGKQGFIDYFERMARDYPGKHVDIKRSFVDGDHVILHCHQVWPEGLEYAGRLLCKHGFGSYVTHPWITGQSKSCIYL